MHSVPHTDDSLTDNQLRLFFRVLHHHQSIIGKFTMCNLPNPERNSCVFISVALFGSSLPSFCLSYYTSSLVSARTCWTVALLAFWIAKPETFLLVVCRLLSFLLVLGRPFTPTRRSNRGVTPDGVLARRSIQVNKIFSSVAVFS